MGISIKLNNVYLYGVGSVATKEEATNLKDVIDIVHKDLYAEAKTYVEGEKKMLLEAINVSLKKVDLTIEDIDYVLGGDLSNQIANSNFIGSYLNAPFLGLYAACATSILSLGIASIILEANFAHNILCFTSSSYGTSERQFRYPTSYGLQKKLTSTITVNGAVSIILSKEKSKIKLEKVTFGRVIDSNSSNVNDMGSIMAIACFDTILKHINDNNDHLKNYDLILTGDLSTLGLNVLKDMLRKEDEDVSMILDAGEIIYKGVKDKYQGGSGPACLPLVGFTLFTKLMLENAYKRVIYIATGALHSKESVASKNTINVIAHALEMRVIE